MHYVRMYADTDEKRKQPAQLGCLFLQKPAIFLRATCESQLNNVKPTPIQCLRQDTRKEQTIHEHTLPSFYLRKNCKTNTHDFHVIHS